MDSDGNSNISKVNPVSAARYTIGWICAIQVEYEAAARMLDEEFDDLEIDDNNTYLYGRIGKHNVVIGCLPKGVYGISSAATVARDMVRSFTNLKFALMVGIGGGAPTRERDIRLGDVVVSCPQGTLGGVIQYDFGKRIDGKLKRVGQLNEPPQVLLQVLPELERRHNDPKKPDNIAMHMRRMDDMPDYRRPDMDKLYRSDYPHCGGKDCTNCADAGLVDRPIRGATRQTVVHYGIIASANSLMKDAEERDQHANNPELNVLCFEMEAAGLMNNYPCLVIKGVSDYSDSHKNDKWQKYAALAAAAYAKELLIVLKPQRVAGLEPLASKMQEILQDIHDKIQNVDDQTQHIRSHQQSQEDKATLEWLSPLSFSAEQSASFSRRYRETGTWLLDTVEFRTWTGNRGKTLFCPGIPGAGKTILASVVIDHLQSVHRMDCSVGIAYIYFNFKQKQHEPIAIVRNLLKQFAQTQLRLPETVKSLHAKHRRQQTEPSFEDALQSLKAIVSQYSTSFIVIDALDEYLGSEGSRQLLISTLLKMQSELGSNIFVSSRPNDDISRQFHGALLKEIRAKNEDVEQYLDGRMSSTDPEIWDTALRKEVKCEIQKAADGMFLLVQLHAENLLAKPTKGDVKEALQHLERGIDGLFKLYEQAMERISSQEITTRQLALGILVWIVHAKRTLSTTELQHALAIRPRRVHLDKDFIPSLSILKSRCAGLVIIDGKSKIVRLVHYTAQQYFEKTSARWFPDAEKIITQSCITYLSFDVFSRGICRSKRDFNKQSKAYALYDYAAQNWGHHARIAFDSVEDLIARFLQSVSKISAASQVLFVQRYHFIYNYRSTLMTGLHIAAHFGLDRAILDILKNKCNLNPRDCLGQTPLSWAAMNGNEASVRLLLDQDEIDANSKDHHGETPMSLAARNGHEAVVELLIHWNNDKSSSRMSTDCRTSLFLAAGNGHAALVKLLISQGNVDADSSNNYGNTPLLLAAIYGHEAVVKFLISRNDVDINSQDKKSCRTPLGWAAMNGHAAVVQLLLKHKDIKTNAKDVHGHSPLWSAIVHEHEAVVNLLAGRDDVDINISDENGRTLLSRAATHGYQKIVQRILEKKKVGADTKDSEFSRTPLAIAAMNGHAAVVQLLVDRDDVEADSRDSNNQTPLSLAAMNGHDSITRLLVDRSDVDADSKDLNGRTPLIFATVNKHEKVAMLLINRDDVDPNVRDQDGRTLLQWSVKNQQDRVVKLLLENDMLEINAKDNFGETSLSQAVGDEYLTGVKLLLDRKDLDVNSRDGEEITPLGIALDTNNNSIAALLLERKDLNLALDVNNKGYEPLFCAAMCGNETVVKLLLGLEDEGAFLCHANDDRSALLLALQYGHERVASLLVDRDYYINAKDYKTGNTPLIEAVYGGFHVVLRQLLSREDVLLDSRNAQGLTALNTASVGGHLKAAQLLIEHGADISAPNNNGMTPLHNACNEGHLDIVQLLVENGAHISTLCHRDLTPLSVAAIRGHEAIVKFLLQQPGIAVEGRPYDRSFQFAALFKHSAVVKLLLDQNDDGINSTDQDGKTSLLLATMQADISLVKLLLSYNSVDVNHQDNEGLAPLSVASWSGREAIASLLLDRKDVDINVRCQNGTTPLSIAADYGNEIVVRLLLSHGNVDVNSRDKDGRTPLMIAAQSGREKVVELLLTRDDVDANLRARQDVNALGLAAWSGNEAVIKLLLAHGVDVNSSDTNGWTALKIAIRQGTKAVVELLLAQEDIDVNLSTRQAGVAATALALATWSGMETMVKQLLDRKEIEVNPKDSEDKTPLYYAASMRRKAVTKLLLDSDRIDVNSREKYGWTALSAAISQGYEDIVKLLLDRDDIEIDLKNMCGLTPLAIAAGNGQEAMVKLLLHHDINLNSVDIVGRTPLMYSTMGAHAEVASILLKHPDVNRDLKDKEGRTAMIWAARNGHGSLVKLFIEHGVKLNLKDKNGWTALSWAAMKGHETVVDILIGQVNVKVDWKDKDGRTPLCLAAMMGKEEVVRLLLNQDGVDKHAKDKYGRAPRWWAAKRGHKRIVRLLRG